MPSLARRGGGLIAFLALLIVALPAWAARNEPPPPGLQPVEIHITAEQFAWNIHYPGPDRVFGRTRPDLISASNPLGIDRDDGAAKDDIGLLNVLMLPVNRPAVIQLTSRDVIHSFTLNEMRVKQDATPGLLTPVWFTPTQTGTFEVVCSQLCGLGHYRMRAVITVESEDDYRRFLATEAAALK